MGWTVPSYALSALVAKRHVWGAEQKPSELRGDYEGVAWYEEILPSLGIVGFGVQEGF